MIYALMIGRKGSKGFPNKNVKKVFGKSICEYPIIAAKKSKLIDKIFISTDCDKIKKITKKHNVHFLDRPKKYSSDRALGDDVFVDGYKQIKKLAHNEKKKIEMIVLLFANVATINSKLIIDGIKILRKKKTFDSAVSTSIYNMWSPLRARKLDKKKGNLTPFVPFKIFGNPKTLSCDRDSQGDVYFADMSVNIVRPHCLENISKGLLPQKWMGRKIAPIFSQAGFDIDFSWQLPSLKYWIKKYGK
jgi:CMP-N-acetylneuraminic acid synthetase